FFASRRRHTRSKRDWSSDVCSSDLGAGLQGAGHVAGRDHRAQRQGHALAGDEAVGGQRVAVHLRVVVAGYVDAGALLGDGDPAHRSGIERDHLAAAHRPQQRGRVRDVVGQRDPLLRGHRALAPVAGSVWSVRRGDARRRSSSMARPAALPAAAGARGPWVLPPVPGRTVCWGLIPAMAGAASEGGEQMASRRISLGMPTPRRTDQTAESLPDTSDRPDTPALADRFGREATDLRLSLTDFCNLRCTYCMPASGLTFLEKEQLLSVDEVVRLVRIGVERLGIAQVRFTGGEPLTRPDLEEIIAGVAALEPRPDISLTTNAIGLDHRAARLRAAGLDRINVSLDSVVSETFERLSRRPLLHRVLAGIDGAREAGLSPIKVNAVLLPGVNDHELPDLLEWCLDRALQLRVIEQMPLDADHIWDRGAMITAGDV